MFIETVPHGGNVKVSEKVGEEMPDLDFEVGSLISHPDHTIQDSLRPRPAIGYGDMCEEEWGGEDQKSMKE